MRLVRILVAEADRAAITSVLESEGVDYVISGEDPDGEGVLIEFPLPTDAVGDILRELNEAGYEETYTVIGGIESARTPHTDELMDRYADDFDPLTSRELRSKARDLSRDPRSFYAMMLLSALIATVGLLTDTPAIVVGSMVIAPIVGPALAASVGAALGDHEMLWDSIRLQAFGLLLAIVGATVLAFVVRTTMFAQPDLDLGTIELIGVRLAPGLLALIVGTAAGAAAAFGITTKGPTSLIGVMIAAALVPTAAATGIAIAWLDPLIALGTVLLLTSTIIAINIAVTAVLLGLGYRPERSLLSGAPSPRTALAVALLVSVVLLTGATTVGQVTHERTVNGAVHAELDDHEELQAVAVRSEYRDFSPFTDPETVTVIASDEGSGEPPDGVAASIEERIEQQVDREVNVRVRFQEYQTP